MILDQAAAVALNSLLRGDPTETITWSPNGGPEWQADLVQRLRAVEPSKRMQVYRLALAGRSDRAAIEAEVFQADRTVDLDKLHLTDTGNAEAFSAFFGQQLRWDHLRGKWLVWQEHRWIKQTDGEVQRLAIDTIRRRYEIGSRISDKAERQAVIKHCLTSESANRLGSMLEISHSLFPISDCGEGWDSDPWLLGCSNGIVDLRTGDLRPGHPADRITMSTNIEYHATAQAPRWMKFLGEIFDGNQEMIDFVQRALGYSLTGDTREQCLFLCWGGGANGKSTMLSTVRRALGDYAHNTSFGTFELSRRDTQTNDIASLYGSRLVTASETNEATRLNEARVKAITGGDPITCRYLFREYFTYTPTFKVFLAMNHLPNIFGTDNGIWRRIRLIPFTVSFLGREDKTLDASLSEELPGILAWIVRGVRSWLEDGLQEPEMVIQATNDYRIDSDLILQFLEACTVKNDQARVSAGELYKTYKGWCQDGCMDPMNQHNFGRRMRERGVDKQKIGSAHYYLGLGLLIDQGLFKDHLPIKDD